MCAVSELINEILSDRLKEHIEMEIDHWMNEYKRRIIEAFGEKALFIGLQGSYARGEASSESDIDVVLILDELTIKDLDAYRRAVEKMPHRDRLCGFVSGISELKNWDKAELVSFYFDTIPFWGSLDFLRDIFSMEDAIRAAHSGACGIYHACIHNYLHARDESTLNSISKSALFTLRIWHYAKTGNFIHKCSDLTSVLGAEYKALFDESADFDERSSRLINWSGDMIRRGM